MQDNHTGRYLPTLDGWRAVAILAVVFNHALRPAYCAAAQPAFACRFVFIGGYGVALFFALSGFLITSRLLDEHAQRGAISLRNFYLRRAFRILPAALVFLAVAAVLGAVHVLPIAPIEIWSSVFFFRNYVPLFLPHNAGIYTSQFWSLAVEEHFYLLWPLLLILGLRSRRALQIALVGVVAIALWRRGEAHFRFVDHMLNLPFYQFAFRTDTRLDALLWGCLLALALRDVRYASWIRRGTQPMLWTVLVVLTIAGMAVQLPGVLWFTVLSPLLIVGTLLHPQTWVGRLLETRPLRWIGHVSYSLYLWHPLVMPQDANAVVLPRLQAWPLNVALALGLTVLSYYFVEKPLIRFGHRLTSRKAVVAPEVAATVSG